MDSNHGHLACKASALNQLSYTPILVDMAGIEPTTSRVSGGCSTSELHVNVCGLYRNRTYDPHLNRVPLSQPSSQSIAVYVGVEPT